MKNPIIPTSLLGCEVVLAAARAGREAGDGNARGGSFSGGVRQAGSE